jgi:hypothetical protein
MTPEDPPEASVDPEVEEIRAVVPPRAVLTELARGFLLVHQSNPARAVRFAETFLKEHVGRVVTPRVEPVPQLTLARLSLGRFPHGPVEPPGWPASP